MRPRCVLRVYLIEAHEGILQARIGRGTHRLAAVEEVHLIRRDVLEKIGLTAHELRERGTGIRNDAPDYAIQLGAAAIIRCVSDELNALAGIPSSQPKPPAADAFPRQIRSAKLLTRNALKDVLGDDVDLVNEVVERFRPALLVPDDRGEGVADRDRVDVGDLR